MAGHLIQVVVAGFWGLFYISEAFPALSIKRGDWAFFCDFMSLAYGAFTSSVPCRPYGHAISWSRPSYPRPYIPCAFLTCLLITTAKVSQIYL